MIGCDCPGLGGPARVIVRIDIFIGVSHMSSLSDGRLSAVHSKHILMGNVFFIRYSGNGQWHRER